MSAEAIDQLREWVRAHRRVFVLTGAGVSTGSGIPDYRDERGEWKRPQPVTIQAFLDDDLMRRRYWARSMAGWPRFRAAQPNGAHRALARWERQGGVSQLLTQNVDGLHEKAGSLEIALHGRLDVVRCLTCDYRVDRERIQRDLEAMNPAWLRIHARPGPDGDADIEGADFAHFVVPPCPRCSGILKPDVVFFGENVPRARFEAARDALAASDALLVVGSSLMVYSGFRFARMAFEAGVSIAILTRGLTRADGLASLKLDADCAAVLPHAVG